MTRDDTGAGCAGIAAGLLLLAALLGLAAYLLFTFTP
jgi:hypothetical protein